jgi:hypothetical protein
MLLKCMDPGEYDSCMGFFGKPGFQRILFALEMNNRASDHILQVICHMVKVKQF